MNGLLKRVTVNPAFMTGAPGLGGLRATVSTAFGPLSAGAARGEILKSRPIPGAAGNGA